MWPQNPIKIDQIIQILKGEVNRNSVHTLKKDMFTIDVTKLNKYHRIFSHDTETKNFIKAKKFFLPVLRSMKVF